MMGRFGAPRWATPTSVPDQQFIYPLGGVRMPFLVHAVPKGQLDSMEWIQSHYIKSCLTKHIIIDFHK